MRKVFIIAEAGVNHNGSLRIAKKLIDIAAKARCDAVKFQTFKAEALVSKYAPKAGYQKKTTGREESQMEMIKKLELDPAAHKELIRYCRKKGIKFISTPFDLGSIDLLASLGMDIFKIPSGEITNLPYLRRIGSLRKKVIMSTGMSNMKEIGDALDVLVKCGTKKKDIAVLHCNTAYPTPFKHVNLLAMPAIREKFGVRAGYSDHTRGIEVAVAAAALGASVIEKHFTVDKNMKGPDHKSSLEPEDLKQMVRSIRNISKAMGSRKKFPSPSEKINKSMIRKSIVALADIKKGDAFTKENITTKRYKDGISPMRWDEVMGRTAKRNFGKDETITL